MLSVLLVMGMMLGEFGGTFNAVFADTLPLVEGSATVEQQPNGENVENTALTDNGTVTETPPSTSPETSPSTSPETSPSTSPEVSPSTSPEVSPSTSPEVSPSTSPETSPSENQLSDESKAKVSNVEKLILGLGILKAMPEYQEGGSAEAYQKEYEQWQSKVLENNPKVIAAKSAFEKLTAEEKAAVNAEKIKSLNEWVDALKYLPKTRENNLIKAIVDKVYVSDTGAGTGDGSSAENACSSLSEAYKKLAQDGTVYVVGTVTVDTAENMAASGNSPTVTSATAGTGILKRAPGNNGPVISSTGAANSTIKLSDITIEDASTSATNALISITPTDNKGGLILDTGTKIINGKSTQNGSAVYVNGTGVSLTMNNGCEISGCSGSSAVYIDGGAVFNMVGGLITRNTTSNMGGGVYLNGTSIMTMTGGSITGNHATVQSNGGVALCGTSQLKLSGAPNITGNTYGTEKKNANVGYSTNEITVTGNLTTGAAVGLSFGAKGIGNGNADINVTAAEGITGIECLLDDTNATRVGVRDTTTATNIIFGNAQLDDVYISATGSDSNAGSQASPLKTLKKAYDVVKTNGVIHVVGEVPVNAVDIITVSKNVTIISDGSGILKRASDCKNKVMIDVTAGSLTLNNVTLDGGATYTNNITKPENVGGLISTNQYSQLVRVNASAVLNLDNNATLQNNAIVSGTHTATDGNSLDEGSAIHVNGGALIVNNGTIKNNLVYGYAADGAAISSLGGSNASVAIHGGSITNNFGQRIGSAIRFEGSGGFTMTGGSVSGNWHSKPVDGSDFWGTVCVRSASACNVGGTAVIANNDGANLAVDSPATYFKVTTNLAEGANINLSTGGAVGDVIGTATNSMTGIDKITSDDGAYVATLDGTNIKWAQNKNVYVDGANGDDTNNGSFNAPVKTLGTAYAKVPNNGTVFVKGDINVTSQAGISSTTAKTITIESCDEKGKAYTETLGVNDSRIKTLTRTVANITTINVGENATVNLRNIKITDNGNMSNSPVITNTATSTLNLNEGTHITGTKNYFGAVYMFNGTVNMNVGASITNNVNSKPKNNDPTVEGLGAGVTVTAGTFNMNGGEISNNRCTYGFGGGIGANGGTVNVNNASVIKNNTAKNGGGMALIGSVTSNITSGAKSGDNSPKIQNNTATVAGGGVYLDNKLLTIHDQSNDLIKINSNLVNSKANNLYISTNGAIKKATINLNTNIGITTETAPSSLAAVTVADEGVSYGSENIAAKAMFSDNTAYTIVGDTASPYAIKLALQTDVYVASYGKDTNAGTQASPFRTLKHAGDVVANNGTINVMDTVPVANADNLVVAGKTIIIQQATGKTGMLKRAQGNVGEIITVNASGVVNLINVTVDGGAKYANDGKVNPQNATAGVETGGIVTNRGYHGQLVVVGNGGTLKLETGAVLQNNAILATNGVPNDRGSAIWVEGTLSMVAGSTIKDNCLSGYASDGAAFSIYTSTGNASLSGGEITNNYADRMGSAIRLSNGTINLGGTTKIHDNHGADGTYGAICYNSGTLNLGANAQVYGNTQGKNNIENNIYLMGSATPKITVALGKDATTGAKFGITSDRAAVGRVIATNNVTSGSTDNVDYNTCFTYDGGAFKVANDATHNVMLASASEVYVGSNGSDTNPGTLQQPYKTLAKAYAMANDNNSIFVIDDMTDMTDFVLDQNKTVTITSCDANGVAVADNTGVRTVTVGGSGNHFTLRGNAKVIVKNLNIKDGNATGRTGRLFMANDGGTPTLTLGAYATLSNGKSLYSGGAIYWGYGTLNMEANSSIKNCYSKYDGGAVYLNGGIFNMNGGAVENNNADNNGGGVYYASGTFNAKATATVKDNTVGTTKNANNLYLANGKTVNVTAALEKSAIGITAEKCGDLKVLANIQVAKGSTATAAMFTNDCGNVVPKRQVAIDNVNHIVYLSRNNNTNISMGITYPNANNNNYPANGWDFNVPEPYVNFSIPYWTKPGDKLTLNTHAESGGQVTYNGTNPTGSVTVGGIGEEILPKIDLPLNDTTKTQYFTVTALDGTTQVFKINLKTVAQSPKAITFNFDGVDTGRTDATATAMFKGLEDGNYTFKEEGTTTAVDGLTATAAGGTVTLTATAAEYYTNIGKWTVKEITGTNIKVATHERNVEMYNASGDKIGTILIHTNNASATDLLVVEGINTELGTTTYQDAFQVATDATTGHPQATSKKDINNEADAKTYIDEYVKEAVTAYDAKVSAGSDAQNALDSNKYATVVNTKEFIAPQQGTAENKNGKNGAYSFTVTVACGGAGQSPATNPPQGAAVETVEKTIIITAHPYGGASVTEIKSAVNTLSPSGTVYVDFGTSQNNINTAVDTEMSSEIDTALQGLTASGSALAGTTISNNNQWTVSYNGNYSATATLSVTKDGNTTTTAVTVPLTMTVNVRPNIDELVIDSLATALRGQNKTFDDMLQVDVANEGSIKTAIQGKFSAITSVAINKKHSAEITDLNETITFGSGYTYSIAVNPVGSGYTAAKACSATDGDGEDGQYLFTVDVTLTKGTGTNAKTLTKTLAITASAPIVAKGKNTDAGIYITATSFNGVTDIAAVDIVKSLLDNNSPSTHSLVYENRNNATVRLAEVQKWVDETIMAGGDVTVTSGSGSSLTQTNYVVKNGVAQLKSGNGASSDLKGTATAVLTGTSTTLFTTEGRPASDPDTGDVTENYTINIVKQTSGKKGRSTIATGTTNSGSTTSNHSFSHREMVGVTVIGGTVNQNVNGKQIPATGTTVTLTSPNGKAYTGKVNTSGNFEIHNVEPATGGTGFSVYFDDGRKQTKAITGVTVTPHTPDDTLAEMTSTSTGGSIFPTVIVPPYVVGEITGSVTPEKSNIDIKVYYGETELASAKTDAIGNFKFTGLPYGNYRLVAIDGKKTVSQIFEVKSGTQSTTLAFPDVAITGTGNANTKVEQLDNTPPTTVDFPITELFSTAQTNTTTGLLQTEIDKLKVGCTAEIKLVAEEKTEFEATDDRRKVEYLINSNPKASIGMLLDLSVVKSVVDSTGAVLTSPTRLTEVPAALKILVEVPKQYQGLTANLSLYRVHEGVAAAMPTSGEENFSFTKAGDIDYLQISSKLFSSYVLVYTQPSDNGGNGGGTIAPPAPTPTPTATPTATPKPTRKPKPTVKPTDDKDDNDSVVTDSDNGSDNDTLDKDNTDNSNALTDDGDNSTTDVSGDNVKTYKCSLCHHCPTFLGICLWIWLVIILISVAIIICVVWLVVKRKKNDENKYKDQTKNKR